LVRFLPYYAKGASIEFIDENLFKTIVYLGNDSGKSAGKSSGKILALIEQDKNITIPQIAENLNITTRGVEKQIAALKKQGVLKREGSRKSGYWKITNKQIP
jgi:ATP-dependent DNA helicase RecG